MFDFFHKRNSLQHQNSDIEFLFEKLYDVKISLKPDTFFGLNLFWPAWDLPQNCRQYLISFHTEYINLAWVLEQAKKVYPKKILLICEFDVAHHTVWPDNIVWIQQRTIHKQLALSISKHGYCKQPTLPQYKFSSLCFRVDQYKLFVTAFLLKNISKNDMILTYHDKKLGPWPDDVNIEGLDLNLSAQFINFNDNFNKVKNFPVANARWQIPPFQNALINLTNESIAASTEMIDSHPINLPGPYFTEKTFKPLLSARPFISVGQFESLRELQQVGFDTNFGLPNDYDSDPNNFTRIHKIFDAILYANNNSIKDLFDSSYNAVRFNINHIVTGTLRDQCNDLNKKHKEFLQSILT